MEHNLVPAPWISILAVGLSVIVVFWGVFFLSAETAVVLLAAGTLCAFLLVLGGVPYAKLENCIVQSASRMMLPILRLMAVGMLIGTWMASGTVPYMIYCGLRLLRPTLFLPLVCLLCAVMSSTAGTSWGTVATVGVACMSIAAGLGIPKALAAGAVVTGSLFGDKVSPMSDSVILTASITDTPLMEGVRHVLLSTGPAYLASLLFFLVAGLHTAQGTIGGETYTLVLAALEQHFYLHPILLLPPVLLFGLILGRKPTLPAFAAGIAAGLVLAISIQHKEVSSLFQFLFSGYQVNQCPELVAQMLERGGLTSMLPTIALLLSACVFGAPIQCSGALNLLLGVVKRHTKSGGSLANGILLLHGILFTITGSYYVSAPVIAETTRDLFPAYGLEKKNLMRILQDTGTGLSALVPWAATGVYITSILGLNSTIDYLPYVPMLWLSIMLSVVMHITGIGIPRAPRSN